MSQLSERLLGAITDWLMEKDARYVCKDNLVYWQSRLTTASLNTWHSMTLSEVARTVLVTKLTVDDELTENMVIACLQEIGAVYEMSIKSDYTANTGILNLKGQNEITTLEKIVIKFVSYLVDSKIQGVLMKDVTTVIDYAADIRGLGLINYRARNMHLRKHLAAFNYALREGAHRITYQKNRTTAILAVGATSAGIIRLQTMKSVAANIALQ